MVTSYYTFSCIATHVINFFLCGESQRENAEYRSTLVNVRMLLSCIPVQIISNNYFNRCKEVKCQYDQTDNDLLKIYTKIKFKQFLKSLCESVSVTVEIVFESPPRNQNEESLSLKRLEGAGSCDCQ